MLLHTIRKIIQKTGFDFHRHYPKPNKMEVAKSLNINTVLDIGANVGQFASEIRKILPNAFIYSFEPLGECFKKLEDSFSEDKNFKAFNFALGEKTEELDIEKNEYAPSSSILPLSTNHTALFPHAIKTAPEKISVKRLDDTTKELNLNKEILIKLDVQGFEDKVIAGGESIFKIAKVIIIETSFVELYKNQPSFDDIYQKLKSLGFKYHGSIQEKVYKHSGKVISEDSLFIRNNE